MRALTVLGFVASGMLVAGFTTSGSAQTATAKVVTTPPCKSVTEAKLAQQDQIDLSSSGLKFDPRAPGGARPEEEQSAPVPVNPATTTLFPASAAQPKLSGGNNEKNIPCRP